MYLCPIFLSGLVYAVAKETEFEFWGFIFVMLASVMSGFRWSMTQILLQVWTLFFSFFFPCILLFAIRNPFVFQATIWSIFCFLFVGLDPDTFPRMMHFMPYWMWSEKHMVSVSALTCRFVFYYWISFGSVSVDFSARLQGQNYQFVLAILSFIPKLSASVDDMLCCFIKWNNLHIRLDELLFESIQCHFILTLSFFLATLWRCFIQNSIIIFFSFVLYQTGAGKCYPPTWFHSFQVWKIHLPLWATWHQWWPLWLWYYLLV